MLTSKETVERLRTKITFACKQVDGYSRAYVRSGKTVDRTTATQAIERYHTLQMVLDMILETKPEP